MKIIVDADACPNIKQIEEMAIKYNTPLTLFADYSHHLKSDYAEIIQISTGIQNVDIAIANTIKPKDILITADYGLAVIGLAKDCVTINPSGLKYTNENIDTLIFQREVNKQMRKQKIKIKGPKKRTKENETKFMQILEDELKPLS